MSELLSMVWVGVGIALMIAILFIIPILIEIKKTLKAYRIISERVELASDLRSWFKVVRFFRKDKD